MTWKSIVAGVDDSPEGARAATVAWNMAQIAHADCHLVHCSNVSAHLPAWIGPDMDMDGADHRLATSARSAIEEHLRDSVPPEAQHRFQIRRGSIKVELPRALQEVGADLLVLGGKHHSTLGRWLAGSTVHYAVRTVDVPVLVSSNGQQVERIIAAVDLSHASGSVLVAARRMADLFGAALRVVHVVSPAEQGRGLALGIDGQVHHRKSELHLDGLIDTALGDVNSFERRLVSGKPVETLMEQAGAGRADMLIVGSHGKGWFDRLLIGSVTEALLNQLPTSMLVVPVSAP